VKQNKFFEVKEGKIEGKGRNCDRCGEGTRMAEHKQENGKKRYYCGKCHLTIWE
jgi:ribosomal protein S27AE